MRTFATVLVAAAAVAVAVAECPNGCSGHGTCGANDACTCYDNWQGGDCSQRVCPFGLSFVDTPLGDLNHDGEAGDVSPMVQWANNAQHELGFQAKANQVAHFYSECSGKGACDRATGMCACFDGYSGSSCQRTTCPNDCSGKGQCYTLREIADGDKRSGTTTGRNFRVENYEFGVEVTSGVSATFDYNLWDADKNQACVCDPGYFGVDCSLRDCPRGADPLATDKKYCGNTDCAAEKQYLVVTRAGAAASTPVEFRFEWTDSEDYSGLISNLKSKFFILKDSLSGNEYAELVQDALETFPNNVLGGVTVTCVAAEADDVLLTGLAACDTILDAAACNSGGTEVCSVELEIDFANGPQGDVADITVTTYANTPATDMDIASGATFADTYVEGVTADGTTPNSPCSNRGLCDYSTGQCACFSGYTREDCSVQNALSM